jgi:LDH2 family malate/lactate/ureidoglycolate dehydrogenase
MIKIVNAKQLSQQVSQLFVAAGTPEDIAQRVAESLVLSDMMGHASHGVIRVSIYLDRIKQGSLVPDARPLLVRETAVTGLVDGQNGLGQLTAHYGATLACEKAEAEGLAAVGLFNCQHVGRLGEWVGLAATRGLIGLAFCSSGPPGGLVTPFGGAGRVFGTNPIAAAIPAADRPAIVIDFATSVSAEGKLKIARNLGQPVPEGTILNRDGQSSTNPEDFYEGGVMLPFGGHKGSALALLVDVLGGIIIGAGCASLEESNLVNGVLFLMLNPGVFQTHEAIERDLGELLGTIKATPPAAGFEEVLLPGEPEQRKLAQQRQGGVRVDETTWENLQTAAQELGVSFSLGASQ